MATATVVQFEEPRLAKWLFGSSKTAWFWLVARLWLGWEWLHAGWGKLFGGNITWKVWDWGKDAFSLTGDGNIGWIRSGTIVTGDGTEVVRGIGDSVAGFAARAIESSQGAHPDVAYSWYVNFLEFVRDDFHPILGPIVAIGEFTIGLALLLGAFTGIAAFLGAILLVHVRRQLRGKSGDGAGLPVHRARLAERRLVRARPLSAPEAGRPVAEGRFVGNQRSAIVRAVIPAGGCPGCRW